MPVKKCCCDGCCCWKEVGTPRPWVDVFKYEMSKKECLLPDDPECTSGDCEGVEGKALWSQWFEGKCEEKTCATGCCCYKSENSPNVENQHFLIREK